MMRENKNTKCCEYIIICLDGLYIASTTPEVILLMLKDKYKINIYLQDKYPHDPGIGSNICQIKEYHEYLCKIIYEFSKTNYLKIYILHFKLSSY